MTSTQIVEHLAREFASSPEQVRATLEMLDAGLRATFIGRVRRAATNALTESAVRKLDRRRHDLEELDRRRGTILRMLESAEGSAKPGEAALERVRACMDRFELEDLFLPHRRPEPEVQLALDRGLGRLADALIAPVAPAPDEPEAPAPDTHEPEPAHDDESASAAAGESGASVHDAAPISLTADSAGSHEEIEPAHDAADPAAPDEPEPHPQVEAAAKSDTNAAEEALLHGHIDLTPALARLCSEYVSPDRGLHTEAEALAGAMRILSDRLGRDPRLRGLVRKLLRKHGILNVRPAADESRLGRHKPLAKLSQPLRQVQGHKLLAIRQAQKERAVSVAITLPRAVALPKVRAALGTRTNPDYAGVLDAVALRTLEHRLLPLLEADVRLELKERGDEEALRFLSQHLRQVLLTPPAGRYPFAGVDVSAKGDWTIVQVDEDGSPGGAPVKIEVGEKDAAALGTEIAAAIAPNGAAEPLVAGVAIGHGKMARAALGRLRAALRAAQIDLPVMVVNDSGVSSYASSEVARSELGELSVPQRIAVSLARRLQDPMAEILKVDPRHLALGSEQGLVTKAALARAYEETIESCAALVGCELARAPQSILQAIPGLDAETARRLRARMAEAPIASRDELRECGLVTEVQWTNAAGSLRIRGGPEPLDATHLHPEQYELARRVLEAAGASVEDGLGRPGATKGLRRDDFGVDDATWRDLMREIFHPGRDPRPPLQAPRLLAPDTDRVTLTKDRVLDGVVTAVASFGAFVDIGLEHDGMVHVSQISDRYVRDARELVSIGEVVRLRVLDGSGQRVSLSMKNVAELERAARRERGGDRAPGGGRGERRGERGPRHERERAEPPRAPVRAAQSRRDGLVTGAKKRGRPERGGDRRGDSGGPRRGPPRGGERDRRPRADEAAPEDLRGLASEGVAYNPFADFFRATKKAEES